LSAFRRPVDNRGVSTLQCRTYDDVNCQQCEQRRHHPEGNSAMVLLEMSITPLGKGESVSQYVAECVQLIDDSGLDYELHAMGTIVEGELDEVLDLMRRCIEQTARHSDRVTCAAKLDFRRGHSGRLQSKIASVEKKLGRKVRKSGREEGIRDEG
jgi:uncharacterized protein (TIGR00106 family)